MIIQKYARKSAEYIKEKKKVFVITSKTKKIIKLIFKPHREEFTRLSAWLPRLI